MHHADYETLLQDAMGLVAKDTSLYGSGDSAIRQTDNACSAAAERTESDFEQSDTKTGLMILSPERCRSAQKTKSTGSKQRHLMSLTFK